MPNRNDVDGLIREHWSTAMYIATAYIRRYPAAKDDFISAATEALWRACEQWKGETPIEPLIRVVCRNRCCNEMKRYMRWKRVSQQFTEEEDFNSANLIEARYTSFSDQLPIEDREFLDKAMSLMRKGDQDVIRHKYFYHCGSFKGTRVSKRGRSERSKKINRGLAVALSYARQTGVA